MKHKAQDKNNNIISGISDNLCATRKLRDGSNIDYCCCFTINNSYGISIP